MNARRILVVTVCGVWLGGRLAAAGVYEPGPEAANAVTAGAADVAAALKLGKRPEAKWDALRAFEVIADAHPAALHDCYLALAYLRVDNATEARLAWDRSGTRNGERPKWCTGDLEAQLAKVLSARYVQVFLDITPKDALVAIDKLMVRNLTSVWLPCAADECSGPSSKRFAIAAEAPGYQRSMTDFALVRPATTASMKLEPVRVVTPPPVDAGVEPPPIADATIAPLTPPDDRSPVLDGLHTAGRALLQTGHFISFKKITAGISLTTAVGAGVFAYLAHYYAGEANGYYKVDPAFDRARSNYEGAGIVAVACAGVATLSFVAFVILEMRGDSDQDEPAHPVGLSRPVDSSGLVLEYGGRW